MTLNNYIYLYYFIGKKTQENNSTSNKEINEGMQEKRRNLKVKDTSRDTSFVGIERKRS